jgi:hypothetical protein
MQALSIKDLSVTEHLDSKAMKAVRGGFVAFPIVAFPSIKTDNSKTVSAQQLLTQSMTANNVANDGNALVDGLKNSFTPSMNGHNNVTVY